MHRSCPAVLRQAERLDMKPRSPLAIGGVGGSGTRLVAQLVAGLGYQLGVDLNRALDDRWFAWLFRHVDTLSMPDELFLTLLDLYFAARHHPRELSPAEIALLEQISERQKRNFSTDWLNERLSLLRERMLQRNQHEARWAWKAPNTHMLLEKLLRARPDLYYIHVVRNGLDMAYSKNQNQLKRWGSQFFSQFSLTPYWSLRFWCVVQRRVAKIKQQYPLNVHIVRFDSFCIDPNQHVSEISRFLGIDSADSTINRLCDLVRPPASIGRFRNYGTSEFDSADIEYVREWGFVTT